MVWYFTGFYSGLWYFAWSRSREIQVNPRNPAKFKKHEKNAKCGRNLIKYMSVQHIWNLFQLLGLKCANNIPKLPGVDYVAKNWALAMMLKALPLVHFWSVLLLKEQMMTSVRKMLKTLVWPAQNRSISSKICLENNHKIGRFLPIPFWWSVSRKLQRNSCEIGRFFREVVPKNPTKFDFFFHDLSEARLFI